MTAAELFAELTAQGFCLEVCDAGIGIDPASRLTDVQIQAIREHKPQLIVLLRGEPPPSAKQPQPEKPCRKKPKRVARSKATVGTDGVQPPAHGDTGADNATSGRRTVPAPAVFKAEAAWIPPCPMCGSPPPGSPNCLRCKGRAELERTRETRPKPPEYDIPNYPLCQRCWSKGYAACGPCQGAHNPALRDWEGSQNQWGFPNLRPLTAEEQSWSWRRCEVCFNPFQGPRYGIPNVCPTCRAGPAICPDCGGRDRAHLRVCRFFITNVNPLACDVCGNPLTSGVWCRHCHLKEYESIFYDLWLLKSQIANS
jgi:hypothetical protein